MVGVSDDLPLTTDDGTRIEWGDFAAVVVGILSGEFYSGLAGFLATVLNAFVIHPLQGASEFASTWVYAAVGRPGTLVAMAFSGTERWIAVHPIVGFALALGIVFGLAYWASAVVTRG